MDLSAFKCMGCGACCRQTGYVRLRKGEPDTIADFLGMAVLDFIETYTVLTSDRQALSLIDKKNGSCIFLTSAGCGIHPVKPAQCLDFPVKWRFEKFQTICRWARGKRL